MFNLFDVGWLVKTRTMAAQYYSAHKNVYSGMEASKKYQNIPEYIAAQTPEVQHHLQALYESIRDILPQAQACISYNMPCFKQQGMVCYFAAFKKHYSLFFSPAHVKHFQAELAAYVKGKSAIQIPIGQNFPKTLLKRMLLHAAEANRLKAENKKLKSKK